MKYEKAVTELDNKIKIDEIKHKRYVDRLQSMKYLMTPFKWGWSVSTYLCWSFGIRKSIIGATVTVTSKIHWYSKVPSEHCPMQYDILYNTAVKKEDNTQLMKETYLTLSSIGMFSFSQPILSGCKWINLRLSIISQSKTDIEARSDIAHISFTGHEPFLCVHLRVWALTFSSLKPNTTRGELIDINLGSATWSPVCGPSHLSLYLTIWGNSGTPIAVAWRQIGYVWQSVLHWYLAAINNFSSEQGHGHLHMIFLSAWQQYIACVLID